MMSDTKFTPGPWEYIPIDCLVSARDDTWAVCTFEDRADEFECDAHLIAAAPELYEALEQALAAIKDFLEYEHDGDPWTEDARAMGEMDIHEFLADGRFDSARAALAKARGEG